jgi:hypothetical protein
MRKSPSILLAAGLLLYPFAAYAEDYRSQASQTQQVPPVAQALVREGDFAIKLAAILNLGLPTNEADAEGLLAKAGVVPLNGWLSDYPMTPEVLGQLQDSIAKAASEGKLPMTAEEGTKGLYDLAAQMNLPTPAGPGTAAPESTEAPAEQPGPAVLNNHYYDQGPPIITYYPPPVYYAYLYDWVPYPVWWFGFWFPGFYICHNFTTVVVVDTRKVIVSNRFVDPRTKRVVRVDPVVRTGTGALRSVTTLRTGDGRRFGTEGFRSPGARKSAEAIFGRSAGRMKAGRVPESRMARGSERRFAAPGAPGKSFNVPSRGEARPPMAPNPPLRTYRPPAAREHGGSIRPFAPPGAPSRQGERRYSAPGPPDRSYNSPVRGGDRRVVTPGRPARPFNGPMGREGRGPMRSSGSYGWYGR